MSRVQQSSNQYDNVTESSEDEDCEHGDTKRLMKDTLPNDSIDITYKLSDDDDPVYEECSTVVNR